MITISDNGCGINYDELKYKFQPFNDSKKANLSQKTNHTLPHGRKGIGRLTFLHFPKQQGGILFMKMREIHMSITFL